MHTLFLVNEVLADSNGISKKILAQVRGLENLGMKVDLCHLAADDKNKFTGRYINGELIDKYSEISILSKIQWRYRYKSLYHYIVENGIQLIYIRYTQFANPFFNSFLKKLYKNNIIVLLELPTYPYDQEFRNISFFDKIILLIEKVSRRKFKNFITRVITLSDDKTVFKIPAIKINNGVDACSIPIAQRINKDNDIHLIGVASINYWHGYDRVIEGLNNYYNANPSKKKVFFDIIGDSTGDESIRYKESVQKYDLGDYVTFYGRRSGKELDDLFNRANIGVGCLGCHRKGMDYSKSLKNREYCARGIPFFYSEIDEEFEGRDFILKVAANDDPIDIDEIVNFAINTKIAPVAIKRYAIENLTWEKQFEKVLLNINCNFKTSPQSNIEFESIHTLI
jgi:hypothetical protein